MTDPIAASNIAAQAFEAAELAPISSFADESSEAASAREHYETARNTVLESCDWSFASNLVFLPPARLPEQMIEDPDLPGLYKLPADCLIVREVRPADMSWRQEGRYVRAREIDGLTARCTRLITNEELLPASVKSAIAYRMAVLLAPRWVSSRTKRADLRQDAADALAVAQRNDARSASPAPYDKAQAGNTARDWLAEVLR